MKTGETGLDNTGKFSIIPINQFNDERGNLSVLTNNIPSDFVIRRVYSVYGTKKGISRGDHSHRNVRQIIFVIKGKIQVTLDDGFIKTDLYLNAAETGLLIMPLVWAIICPIKDDTIYLVLCDGEYQEPEYIRDREEFMEIVRGNK